jgi:hypothetical protein
MNLPILGKGSSKGALVGGVTGAIGGAIVGSAAGGITAVPGAIAGGTQGAIIGYKAPVIKQEIKNVSGLQDQENKAKRMEQALRASLNPTTRKEDTPAPTPGQITGQTTQMSASESETQRRKLVDRLRAGLASTIKTGRNILGTSNVYVPQATGGSKSLLGE